MSDKRIYALTDEQAKWLGYYSKVGGYPALDEVLIPLDRDAAVERVAEAIYDDGGGTHVWVGWAGESDNMKEQFRQDARAALDALLGNG